MHERDWYYWHCIAPPSGTPEEGDEWEISDPEVDWPIPDPDDPENGLVVFGCDNPTAGMKAFECSSGIATVFPFLYGDPTGHRSLFTWPPFPNWGEPTLPNTIKPRYAAIYCIWNPHTYEVISINAYLSNRDPNQTFDEEFTAAIYNASTWALVGSTGVVTVPPTEGTYAWYTFNFEDPKPTLSPGQSYGLAIWSDTVSGTVKEGDYEPPQCGIYDPDWPGYEYCDYVYYPDGGVPPVSLESTILVTDKLRVGVALNSAVAVGDALRTGVALASRIAVTESLKARLKPSGGFCLGHHIPEEDVP